MKNNEFYVVGVTISGGRFRPSDWAERLACLGAQFGPDARLCYALDLQPTFFEGHRALRVLTSLEQRSPQLWATVFDFAAGNGLRITAPSGSFDSPDDTLPSAA